MWWKEAIDPWYRAAMDYAALQGEVTSLSTSSPIAAGVGEVKRGYLWFFVPLCDISFSSG